VAHEPNWTILDVEPSCSAERSAQRERGCAFVAHFEQRARIAALGDQDTRAVKKRLVARLDDDAIAKASPKETTAVDRFDDDGERLRGKLR
jgi:hypothetical protein